MNEIYPIHHYISTLLKIIVKHNMSDIYFQIEIILSIIISFLYIVLFLFLFIYQLNHYSNCNKLDVDYK